MNHGPEHAEAQPRVRRSYVHHEKYNTRGPDVLTFLQKHLGCTTVTKVHVMTRYDIEGLDEEGFRSAAETICREAPVDRLLTQEDFLHAYKDHPMVASKPLPGQYDACAAFTEQCIRLQSPQANPTVQVSDFLLLEGTIDPLTLKKLQNYLINPIDSEVAMLDELQTLRETLPEPAFVKILEGFLSLDATSIDALRKELKLAMILADIQNVQAYFKSKNRDPTVAELRVLDTYWSDHCRHTTFTTELIEIALGGKTILRGKEWMEPEGKLSPEEAAIRGAMLDFLKDREVHYSDRVAEEPVSLMDLALFSMRELRKQGKLGAVPELEENNAATIVVPVHFEHGRTEEWLFLFKNETHNHPTGLEPFGGAATCIGGAIRDPLSGGAYVFMAMRVSGNGDPREPIEQTMPGALPQLLINTVAAAGHSAYGNEIGVPNGKVTAHFHAGYKAKPLECGFCGGATKRENLRRRTPKPGDVVILVGGKTGRDGIGGASGSSKSHDETSVEACGAEVQKGNPTEERKLQRFLTTEAVSKMTIRCNDFGAGGVCVAVGELADGVCINLNNVPLKYLGLEGTEIITSESQERMAVVVSQEEYAEFIRLAGEENLEATLIANITEEKKMIARWQGNVIVDLDRTILGGGWAKREAKANMIPPKGIARFFDEFPSELLNEKSFAERWKKNLARLSVCSKRGLQERFDSTVGGNTVVMPFGGDNQLSPSEAAVSLFPVAGAKTAMAASTGFDADLSEKSPFHGSMYALIDSLARLVATGAPLEDAHLTLQNYFPKTDTPDRWGLPLLSQVGARLVQKNLGLSAIGGKDSMSGTKTNSETGERIDVPPTLISFAVAPMQSQDAVQSHFQKPGSILVHLPVGIDEASVPDWNQLKQTWDVTHEHMQSKKILSCHAVHSGGIAAAISQMSFGNGMGATLNGNALPQADWFTPSYGSLVLELQAGSNPAELFAGIPYTVLGVTQKESHITIEGDDHSKLSGKSLLEAWEAPLEEVFPTAPADKGDGAIVTAGIELAKKQRSLRMPRIAHPSAGVLVLPGMNCEFDTARALDIAGAKSRIALFRNRTRQDIEESVKLFEDIFNTSEIVVLPGGFSAADHPKGSGKFGAAVLRNPRIADAIERHQERGGLIFGICNGFQILVKSCLLPGGKVRQMKEDDPTLTYNGIGRFVSRVSKHRVVANDSPFFGRFDVGETIDIPIAHGEGRLVGLSSDMLTNGQVALQYVGQDGVARMLFPDNPNGSDFSAAALVSDSRTIGGLMGHPERAVRGRSKNVIRDPQGAQVFQGMVDYFK